MNAAPAKSITILTPHLADADLLMRERAAVALGHMGQQAEAARGQIETALTKASTEREKRVMEWALRQINGDE